jgi:PAS domain S-box-containing protein
MRESFGEKLVGKTCWQMFRGESGPCLHCTNDQLLDADGNPTGVFTWEGQNPLTKKWYINHDRAIKWVDDQIVRLQVATDITEIKQAEKSLRDSEARFRSLIEQSPISTVLYTPEGQPTYGNPATAKLWNMPPELVQQVYQTYNILEDKQLADQGILPDIKKGFAGEFAESHPIKYDPTQTDPSYVGPVRWLRAFIYPVKDDDEEIREVVVMHADITDQVNADTALQVNADTALQESEAKFRGLVESSSDWIWEVDVEGVYTYASPQVEAILGYKPEKVIGRKPFDLMPPDEAERVENVFKTVMSQNEPINMLENLNIHKDGHHLYLETSGVPIFDHAGNIQGYQGVDRDITERKRAIEALQEREKRLNTIYENVKEIIFTLNVEEGGQEFRFQSINPAFLEATGLKADQVVGKLVNEVIPEPSLSLVLSNYQRACKNKESVRWEEVTPYPSGNKVGDVNVTPIFDDQGNCTHLIGTVYDITERVQAENELQASEARYRTLFEHASDAIFLENEDDEVIDANRQACEMMGYTRDELLRMSVPDLQAPEVRGEKGTVIKQELDNYGDLLESINLHRNGTRFPVEVSTASIPGQEDGLVLSIVRDITERVQAEKEREKLISELEAKNTELERFTYTVSHDLKSPLITINGFIGYLEEDAISGNMERLRGDIQRIQDAVEKMQRLLDELLELSRIGRLMNPPEMVPFEEIAHEVLDNVHGQLEERGVAVTLSPNLPSVYGDRQRLVEVLQNLVDNAAKCMGEQSDPRIEIGQRGEEDGMPVFYVKDNGIGIAPEYHEKIFGLFEKLDANTEGTGIGLALVKRIVEFHGGRIWAESEAGEGSTFYFSLESGESKT